jgi:hypothetical protein
MMVHNDALISFKNDLEGLIKNRFEKWLVEENSEFHIAADIDTSYRLNKLLNPIGLEVYGMSITPTEFEITFEFIGDYEKLQEKFNAPKYCHISFNNDRNYKIFVSKNNLTINFWLTIADEKFNRKKIGNEKFYEILRKMEETLFAYQSIN